MSQWQITNFQQHMTNLGLGWQVYRKEIFLAGAFFLAASVLLVLRRRKKKNGMGKSLVVLLSDFFDAGRHGLWACGRKKTANISCNGAGIVRADFAVLREHPDSGSHALALLKRGNPVWLTPFTERTTLNGRKVCWQQVRWGNTSGWVWDWRVEVRGQEE